jgi:hypothetical protein
MPANRTDLIERYLHAVKFWLPKAQQADIIAELAEDLRSQVEEREAALGHKLNEDELAAVLKKRGDPLEVASRYLPDQRLINPALLPVYKLVLKIVLLWVLAPLLAIVFVGPVFAVAHPWELLLRCCFEYWRGLFMIVGIVTAVFALFDRFQVKFRHPDDWNPLKLPRVPGALDTGARWKHLAGSIFGVAAATCWVYLLWHRTEFSFPGGPRILLAPVWGQMFWPITGLTLAGALIDLLSALRPRWTRVRSYVRVGIDICGLGLAAILLKAGNLVEIAAGTVAVADRAKAMTWIHVTGEWTLIILTVVVIGDAIQETRRLVRGKRAKPAVISTAA